MIITKTPLRVSFAGGGTDLKEFYSNEPGSVISSAINKYIYIAIHKYFENKILLKYSQTELVDNVNQIKNTRFRECLKLLNVTKGVEITSIADIPTKTGAGASGSFTVALLHAIHTFKGEHVSPEQLAREAFHIESEILKEPVGKQDQYAAAYGGLNFIEFKSDDRVTVTPVICKKEVLKKLNDNLIMFYTGHPIEHKEGLKLEEMPHRKEILRNLRRISEETRDALISGNLDQFAIKMHEGWIEKKKIGSHVSSTKIDEYYEKALAAGAKGGKLLGAGGGGFLLLYCERSKQDKVRTALNLKEVSFNLEPQGSRVIHIGEDGLR